MPPTYFIVAALITATIASGAALWRRQAALRGTTLVQAAWWTLVALATLAGGETLLLIFGAEDTLPSWSAAVRLICATVTFCPVMAVLGARRPHHLAWQFIVVTLWIMLSLPAWEVLLLGRFESMDVGPVRGWFLWLMIALNLVTYLPTRFWMSAILVALGQLLLLGPFLPGVQVDEASRVSILVAAVFFAVAIIRTCGGFPPPPCRENEFDRRWLMFRDSFGTMWALRVVERVNASAQMYNWPMSLTWTGFYFHNADNGWDNLSPQAEAELRQTMENLMRRFQASSAHDSG